jgi:hypothetical protein
MSKLTDELLKDMAEYQTTRPTTYEETALMARELLAARRVVEAAYRFMEDDVGPEECKTLVKALDAYDKEYSNEP